MVAASCSLFGRCSVLFRSDFTGRPAGGPGRTRAAETSGSTLHECKRITWGWAQRGQAGDGEITKKKFKLKTVVLYHHMVARLVAWQ